MKHSLNVFELLDRVDESRELAEIGLRIGVDALELDFRFRNVRDIDIRIELGLLKRLLHRTQISDIADNLSQNHDAQQQQNDESINHRPSIRRRTRT